MFLLAVLALSAMPPFGIFRSEFLIVEGGLSSGATALSAVLIVLVTCGLLGALMVCQPDDADTHASRALCGAK